MKILKVIGILLAVLIALFLIAGAVSPKDFMVERSVNIDAPKDVIYDHISHLKKHDLWSPWAEKDPEMKKSWEGEDGQVGFVSKWESDHKEVGVGEQEITKLVANERVETELRFMEPRSGVSQGYVTMADADKGSDVTWGFTTTVPFPMNAMMLLMNMDKAVGPEFEKGLSKLKTLCESGASTGGSMTFSEIKYPGKTFIGHRETIKWDKMQEFYAKYLGGAAAVLENQKLERDGMPTGLYYDWDEEAQTTDVAASIGVIGDAKDEGEYKVIKLGESKAVQLDYYGNYDGLGKAHEAMEKYLKDKSLTAVPPAVEEYVTDPGEEPDPSKWLTRITYLIEGS